VVQPHLSLLGHLTVLWYLLNEHIPLQSRVVSLSELLVVDGVLNLLDLDWLISWNQLAIYVILRLVIGMILNR
jgi:hypothetical protein